MMNRRTMLIAALAGAVAPVTRAIAGGGMSRISAYAFSFPALSGDDIRLAAFTGKPLLVVNTASLCGYTPQYAGLQEIWNEFRARGLTVIGVPSNDFGGQEPGGTSEITETATTNTALPSRSRPRPSWSERRRTRSTNGQPRRAPRTFRAGTSTNT